MDYSCGSITFFHDQGSSSKSLHIQLASVVSMKIGKASLKSGEYFSNDKVHMKVRRCINLDIISTAVFIRIWGRGVETPSGRLSRL